MATITICNMCGSPFNEWDEQEDFGFYYNVGYGSKHDGTYIRANFCCKCFDKIIDQISKDCVISPLIDEKEYAYKAQWTKSKVMSIIGGK